MPFLPFQSFEARSESRSLPATVPRGDYRGRLSPIGDNLPDMAPPDHRSMRPQWRPAIPLGTTDLWCDENAKDLACRLYAADNLPRCFPGNDIGTAQSGEPQ